MFYVVGSMFMARSYVMSECRTVVTMFMVLYYSYLGFFVICDAYSCDVTHSNDATARHRYGLC